MPEEEPHQELTAEDILVGFLRTCNDGWGGYGCRQWIRQQMVKAGIEVDPTILDPTEQRVLTNLRVGKL